LSAYVSNLSVSLLRAQLRRYTNAPYIEHPAAVVLSVLPAHARDACGGILIAMKLTASQDRDAIGAWLEGQADRQEGKRILGDLPRLQRGEGYLWAPGHGLLNRVELAKHGAGCYPQRFFSHRNRVRCAFGFAPDSATRRLWLQKQEGQGRSGFPPLKDGLPGRASVVLVKMAGSRAAGTKWFFGVDQSCIRIFVDELRLALDKLIYDREPRESRGGGKKVV